MIIHSIASIIKTHYTIMKYLLFPFLILLAGCPGLQPSDFVRFNTNTKSVNISGFSDTTYEYYVANFPEEFTPEKIKGYRADNRNSLTGRITDFQKEEMAELHVRFPDGTVLKKEDILSLKGKTILALNHQNNNFDSLSGKITGPYTDLFYVSKDKHGFASSDPKDFIHINSVEIKSDSVALVKGDFEYTIRELEKKDQEKVKGEFALDFYIGL